MRLMMSCMQCVQLVSGSSDPLAGLQLYPQQIEINDSGIYTVTCRNGHTTSTMSQQHKHETLLELATFAILDGYYREAVTSFAASLERFYEFVVHIGLHELGCDQQVIEASWKEMAKQSERQFGAFAILYTSLFKTKPRTLQQDKIKFRNDVVHKGKVPTRLEALGFGQEVLEIIRSALAEIRAKYPEAEMHATFRRLSSMHNSTQNQSSQPIATMSSPSILDKGQEHVSLEEHLVQQEFWHAKSLIHRYLESPRCDLKNDLLVASAVASLSANQTNQ